MIEIVHTYQNQNYEWRGLAEVLVNINYKNNYAVNITFAESWRHLYFDAKMQKWIPFQETFTKFIINKSEVNYLLRKSKA